MFNSRALAPAASISLAYSVQPSSVTPFMLPMMGIISISGIFYPITALPGWVRKVRPKALGWFPGGPAAALEMIVAEGEPYRPLIEFFASAPFALLITLLVATYTLGMRHHTLADRVSDHLAVEAVLEWTG